MRKHILICILSSCIALSSLGQVNYQWVKSVGGYNSDKGTSVVSDANGNVYVSSLLSLSSQSTADFDPYGAGSGSSSFIPNNSGNCAIAKYDATGNCVWTTSFYGDGITDVTFFVTSLAVSSDGLYLYVSGGFQGNITFGSTTLSASDLKPFIAKYDAGNATLLWVNDLGLTNVVIKDIVPHPTSSYVVLTAIAGQEAIFGKCDDANGNILYVDTLRGAGSITPYGLALDASSNITITGSYAGAIDFDPSPSMALRTSVGFSDIFIAQYTIGGDYIWSNNFGGPLNDIATSLAFNAAGDSIYVAGVFQSGMTLGGTTYNVSGANNGFVAKCDNTNGSVVAINEIKTLSPADSIICSNISLDGQDNIYVAGAFFGKANFTDNNINDTLISNGQSDLFFSKFNAGLVYGWSRSIGGEDADVATDVFHDNSNLYITGYYNDSVDFNIGNGFANRNVSKDPQSTNLYSDIFVLKYALGNATIKGSVTYGPNNDTIKLGNDNLVRLYAQSMFDGNIAMNLIAETTIDNFGKYIFNTIPDGEYLALAVPGINYSATVAPSYYSVNNPYAVQWEDADTITTLSTSPAFIANIKMLEYPVLPFGTGILSGQVIQGNGFDRIAGTPIQGTPIILDGDPGSLIAHTETDANGNYQFDSIPTGCYKIYVNIPGLPMDSTHHRCLDSAEVFVELDFLADSNSIYIEPTSTGIALHSLKEMGYEVYPNPYTKSFVVSYNLKGSNFVKLELYNLLGEKLIEISQNYEVAGSYKQIIDTSSKNLKPGVYLLSALIGNEIITKRILQVN